MRACVRDECRQVNEVEEEKDDDEEKVHERVGAVSCCWLLLLLGVVHLYVSVIIFYFNLYTD